MLRRHHSRPRLKEIFSPRGMGKQGQQSWQKDKGRDWGYWSGSWRSWDKDKNKAGAANQQQGKENPFPSYQAVKIPNEASKESDAGATSAAAGTLMPAGHPEFLKDMQRALNVNRKLDNRARRLTEERATRVQQWEQYQRQLREAFLEQLSAYNADVARIDGELEDLKKQKESAKQNLAMIAEGKTRAAEMAPDREVGPTRQQMDAWEGLMGLNASMDVEDAWKDSSGDSPKHRDMQRMMDEMREQNGIREELMRSQLRQMQNELRELRQSTSSTAAPSPSTPTLRTALGCPLTPQRPVPPGGTEPLHAAVAVEGGYKDHYMPKTGPEPEPFTISPNAARLQAQVDAGDCAKVNLRAPRYRAGKPAPRTPIKEATKTPPPKPSTGGGSLADVVQARRDAMMIHGEPAGSVDSHQAAVEGDVPQITPIDDSADDLD